MRFAHNSLLPWIGNKNLKSGVNATPRCLNEQGLFVPIDFSSGSLQALEYALDLVDPSGEVYLLHVIDSEFVEQLSAEGFSDAEMALERLRVKAEAQLQQIVQDRSASAIHIESMVVVGKPFAEILRIAADLKFSLIAMGIRGRHQGGIEEILFGSTAEKVLRAAPIPVMCVPPSRAQSNQDATQ
ncbi:MAG: universal stress protein [Acidobacteria bacterium]|nr:universal stress protein [Acidobacteriota bacterium]